MLAVELETPALVVDLDILKANIAKMADFARVHGLKLRPHIKAHKITQIAELQLEYGACGLTTSKLSETEALDLPDADFLLAYQLVDPRKAKRLFQFPKISTLVDSSKGVEVLAAASRGRKLPVLVEVDTGLGRAGVRTREELLALVEEIKRVPSLEFAGILTHAGHAYSATSFQEVEKIGRYEGEAMVELVGFLQEAGHRVETVSVGSTPTAKIAGQVPGVTEIRPGNYVFNDAIQVALGVAEEKDCALSVLSTVISTPQRGRAIIDAGSKVLALDKGAHGTSLVQGFGMVKGYPSVVIERLSEEHGILSFPPEVELEIGQVLEIIPNHACPVVNLASDVCVVQAGEVVDLWFLAARGKVQ